MYIAFVSPGNMVITAGLLDSDQGEISESLRSGGSVILDTEKERLEAMASQMGLAVDDKTQ